VALKNGGNMTTAVVFGGLQSLDFQDVRENIVRIPEVRIRIEEAQTIWEKHVNKELGFHQFICSEDATFFNNMSLKSLCVAIVQIGLFDRFKKNFKAPQFLLGDARNDSALLVAAEKISLADLILRSRAAGVVRPIETAASREGLPVLNGQSFAMYEVYAMDTESGIEPYKNAGLKEMDLAKLVRALYHDNSVRKIVNIGPGQLQFAIPAEDAANDMLALESIDLDPMLSWFWKELRKAPASA
jgi:hypothetical protein